MDQREQAAQLDQFINDVLRGKIQVANPELILRLKAKASIVGNMVRQRQERMTEIRQLDEAILRGRGEVKAIGELLKEIHDQPTDVPQPAKENRRQKRANQKRDTVAQSKTKGRRR